MWRTGVCMLLGGCSTLLGIHDFEAPADAAADSTSLPPCFRELFNSGSLDTSRWTAAGTVTSTGAELVIPLALNTIETRSVTTNATFDLTEGDAFVEVPQAVNQAGNVDNGVRITVTNGSSSSYVMSWGAGSLVSRITDEGSSTQETPAPGYTPADKLWRFSHRGDSVTLYTSTTGASWTTRVSHTVSVQPTAVTIELYARELVATGSPGEAHYDNVSVITPACQ